MRYFSVPMKFQILGSSSSGNCALIETGRTRILVDAGFSGKRILELLRSQEIEVDSISAVFLTHEHGDHIAGMRGLSRFPHLRFFANEGTAEAVQMKLSRQVQWSLFETGERFRWEDIEIESLRLPHDAYDPVGFIFRNGGGDLFNPHRSIAWLTDLGYVPPSLDALINEVDSLVVEANHDSVMLERDVKRPFSVKQRIRGRHGHLSNEATRDFLFRENARVRWRQVFLGHLSKDCNTIDQVKTCMAGHEKTTWQLEVVDPCGGPLPAREV